MSSTDYTKKQMTPDQAKARIKVLNDRLGPGVGASRERALLKSIIAGESLTFRKAPKKVAKAHTPKKKANRAKPEPKGPSLESKLGKALKDGNITSAGSKKRMDRRVH